MANIDNAILSIYTVTDDGFLPSLTLNSWPPLTTPFTFAPTCTEGTKIWAAGQNTVLRLSIPDSCAPDSTLTHSPGTCLSGYEMKEIVEFRTPDWTLGGSRGWGAACCRSDYMSTTSDAVGCRSVFTTSITAYQLTDVTTLADGGGVGGSQGNTTIVNSGTVSMSPVLVYWQETDLPKFDSNYAAILASKFDIDFTPTATADSTPETASPPKRSQPVAATSSAGTNSEKDVGSSNSGLSTGAQAGIGVGAVILAILLCTAGFLLYKKRAQRKARMDEKTAAQNDQPEYIQARVR